MLSNPTIPHESIVCGLQNLGSSCYANVVIQVLVNQSNFIYAMSRTELTIPAKGNIVLRKRSLKSFMDLVRSMRDESDYLKPSRFLFDAVALSPGDFTISEQGDACEFLLLLLSKWEEGFKNLISLKKLYNSTNFWPQRTGHVEKSKRQSLFTDDILMLKLYKFREDLLNSQENQNHTNVLRLTRALENLSLRKFLNDELFLMNDFPELFDHRKNIITDMFQGCTVSVLKCTQCNSSRISYPEDFFVLSMPICDAEDSKERIIRKDNIPIKSYPASHTSGFLSRMWNNDAGFEDVPHVSLIDCIRKYCSSSINEFEGVGIKCPFCEKMQKKIEQSTFFLRLPEVLFVSFKRFRFDVSWISAKGKGCKKSDYVHCPFTLDLGDVCATLQYATDADFLGSYRGNSSENVYSRNSVYTLDAVVNHHGNSLLKGHYTCYAYKEDIQKWALFNDHHVGEVTADEVAGSEVYIAVYRKKSSLSHQTEIARSPSSLYNRTILLRPSLKVDILERPIKYRSFDFSLTKGIKSIHRICHYINDHQKAEDINNIKGTSKTYSPKQLNHDILSIPDAVIVEGSQKHQNSTDRRLLNIEWLQNSYWKSTPDPIANLPCYCCPRIGIGQNQDRGEKANISQVDRVFSNLCEHLKMTAIEKPNIPSGKPCYYRYFRGDKKQCHGKFINETYVDVSVEIYTELQSLFGGGPEVHPNDVSSMIEC